MTDFSYDRIWDGSSPRKTCVEAPPLELPYNEYRDLVDIASGVWGVVTELVNRANEDPALRDYRLQADSTFPEGLTMPPAIRADIVYAEGSGFKVVEIDPATALSIGETILIGEIWQNRKFNTISGLVREISSATDGRTLMLDLPRGKSDYQAEAQYAVYRANEITGEQSGELQISAFMEDPQQRKNVNSRRLNFRDRNPLWGSLWQLAGKELMAKTGLMEEILGDYCVRQATSVNFEDVFRSDESVVGKPTSGMGSSGIFTNTAESINPERGYVYQQSLKPRRDRFQGITGEWATRYSIYACRTGICGVQLTSRPWQDGFNNVHGQADSIQTTVSIGEEVS